MQPTKEIFWSGFIGFFEAEGSCIFWTEESIGRTRFRIDASQQDKDLIYFIQKQFGFGNVTEVLPKGGNLYWRYLVEDFPSLLQLIDLLNGNLVLQKKRTSFFKWLQVFNTTHNTQILFRDEAPQITLTDGWLSGFLEGDGGFSVNKDFIRDNKKSQSYMVKQRFFITQKDGIDVLNQIRILLKITPPLRKQSGKTVTNPETGLKEKRFYDRLDTATFESGTILLEYLTRFPFLGKRQITVDCWEELIKYRKTKFPVTASTTATIQKLIDQTRSIEDELQVNPPVKEIE